MSLTVFLAICILGCDVLIYFLYEWAFGESERIRKGHARSRLAAPSSEMSNAQPSHNTQKAPSAAVIEMRPRTPKPAPASRNSNYQERLAYHRIAASHAPIKRRA
jgi:hypothetical protein